MLGSWAYPTTSYVGRAAQDTRPNRVRVAAGFVDDPAQFPIADTAGPRTGQVRSQAHCKFMPTYPSNPNPHPTPHPPSVVCVHAPTPHSLTLQWLTSTEGEAVEGPRIRTIAELRWDDDLRQVRQLARLLGLWVGAPIVTSGWTTACCIASAAAWQPGIAGARACVSALHLK